MLDPRQGSQESSYCFEVPIFFKKRRCRFLLLISKENLKDVADYSILG